MSASAHCLCGKVTFKTDEDISDVGVCHCDMCRRWSSGPFLAVHLKGAPTITGQENIKWFKSSDWAERGFCSTCGTNLFYRITGESPEYIAAAGTFDNQAAFNLKSQIFIDEKPSYYAFAGDIPSMTGAEVFAMYAPESDSSEGKKQ